jgi:protein O-GlcNAc transferase
MNQNNININIIRNYANQHIYNLISIRNDKLSPEEKRIKLQAIFKELINKIRFITNTNEVDVINTPMGIIFQHIKPTIIKLIANCLPKVDKLFIEKELIYNFEWSIRLFKALQYLGAKDIIIWFFLHIPYYNDSISNIDKIREHYYKIVEWMYTNYPNELYLTENEFVFLSNQTCMPYALSYHNKNNVELLTLYSKLIRKICPFVNYFSPRVAESIIKKQNATHTTKPQKQRICFISDSFITDTSVLRDRISIIGKLDRNKYDVYFASFYRFEEINGLIAKVFMSKIKDNYIALGTTLTSARETLEKCELDIIVYPDIGMKLLPTLLAYSRIAPVQITTWGHSETSGIDTIDYFISSEYFAGRLSFDEIQKQYSEKLILFKSLGTFYINPHKLFIENNKDYQNNTNTININTTNTTNTKKFKTREELGFTSKDNLYVCLQTFYKLNPEFEKCLARILELDPYGIILLSNTFPYCKSHLERIRTIMGLEKIKRLKWYGSLEKDEFLNIVSISDVCLDPFPFGGCNTSYDAFAYNIPVITFPSEFLHGQFTNGLYKKMAREYDSIDMIDMTECCVSSADEYAQLASRIGLNEKLRHKISRNIEMNKHFIFQEQESIDEWNIFLSF